MNRNKTADLPIKARRYNCKEKNDLREAPYDKWIRKQKRNIFLCICLTNMLPVCNLLLKNTSWIISDIIDILHSLSFPVNRTKTKSFLYHIIFVLCLRYKFDKNIRSSKREIVKHAVHIRIQNSKSLFRDVFQLRQNHSNTICCTNLRKHSNH